jgi:superfamily II DNA or RNA helicase
MQLRPYQQRGVAELRLAFREGARAPLYVAPTGSGKTVLFCHIAQGVTDGGRSVWIVVHRQELLMQCSRSLDGLGILHDLIAPGHTQGFSHVQVCSVQTLVRRVQAGRMGAVDLIVLDEAHHATAGSWSQVIQSRPDARLLGVTATPIRLDGQGLGKHCGGVFDRMIAGPTISGLIADGFLVKPVVYAPQHQLDMTGVKLRGGDYAVADAAAKVDRPVITGDAVKHYTQLCPGKPALVFCASIGHAAHVAAEFRAAGYRSESIDGTLADGERRKLIEGLGCGQLQVLTSCEIVSEGTDIPVVSAAILLRPTASLGLYLQQVGRALRPAPGKDKAIILDHVGNCFRHGLPEDEWEWTLDGAKRGGAKNTPPRPGDRTKQCPKCYAVSPIGPNCPNCGHVYDRNMQQPDRVEGDLQEITPELAARLATTFDSRRRYLEKKREEWTAEARHKGYKARWVEHRLDALIKRNNWLDCRNVPNLQRMDAEQRGARA